MHLLYLFKNFGSIVKNVDVSSKSKIYFNKKNTSSNSVIKYNSLVLFPIGQYLRIPLTIYYFNKLSYIQVLIAEYPSL